MAIIRSAFDAHYLDYLRLFQEKKFFEAHEVLEELWRETRGREREYYQGLIQLAAALVHFQKENFPGAKELFRTASKYLKPYLPRYKSVNLSKVLAQFQKFLEVWRESDKPELAKKFLPRIALEEKK